jgi:hydroxymethylpyrimidine/phosphomethylpyrimidine kinase
MSRPTVLTIAGFDPTGGAGVLADIKTIGASRCYGVAVITAVTIQNTQGVLKTYPVPDDWLAGQLEALLEDVEVGAVKVGMLGTARAIDVVASTARAHPLPHLVLDPVLRGSLGGALLEDGALDGLRAALFPLAELVTPNLEEAARLTGREVQDLEGMKVAARRIHASGARGVLITGGHLAGSPVDVAFDGREVAVFDAPRVEAPPVHGLGCALSSAVACGLARGLPLFDAIEDAKRYVSRLLTGWLRVGKGSLLPDHLAG